MTRQIIDIGTIGNDGTGDSIRDSFRKVNENFRELYSSLGLGERLTFVNLSDTPNTYLEAIDTIVSPNATAVLTVNNTQDGLAFKQIVSGEGISIDFDSNTDEIKVENLFTQIQQDPSPFLGGDLKAKSGNLQFRILDLPIYDRNAGPGLTGGPSQSGEATSKSYVDSFVSRAGVNHIDPTTGRENSAFGRMSGPLILSRSPEADDDDLYQGLTAATKKYVDESTFGSNVNLYVSTSGSDERPSIDPSLQGTSLAYAYRTVEAALKRAEDMMLQSRVELGPYKKTLTYGDRTGTVTLAAIVKSPNDGVGFTAKPLMSIDTIILNQPGASYFPNDIIDIVGGTGTAARIQILSTASTPGAISAFRIISTGVYEDDLPGTTNIETELTESAAPPGITGVGSGATFNITYKINNVSITNGGSGYGLVSVRIEGGGGSRAFGTADVSNGVIASITITDTGSGFTSIPTVIAELPRFCLFTNGLRTDSTGNPLVNTAQANRAKDLREGLYLKGETSGALAQILTHSGQLGDIDGNPAEDQEVPGVNDLYELFDVDIKVGAFVEDEVISFADITRNLQITVLIESGVYEENYPLKIPPNVALVGDEFRRAIITPRSGMSTSPWVFQKFRRDLTIGADGTTFLREDPEDVNPQEVPYDDVLTITDRLFGHHYLTDTSQPVVAKIQNKGSYDAAATLISLNKKFIQSEIIAWINYNIENNIAPFSETFEYDQEYCRRDVGLIIDSMVYDLKRGGYNRTVSAGLKYRQNASGLIAVTTQLDETVAAIEYINVLVQDILNNEEIDPVRQDIVFQIIDPAYIAEVGSDAVATALNQTLVYVIEEFNSINKPKNNNELDVFLCNDAIIIRSLSCQGHGGFMMVLDPEGQILAKSPYAQECSSFSRSINTQTFAGGQFVDGFTGNLQFKHTASVYTVSSAVVETAGTGYSVDDLLTVDGGDPVRTAKFRVKTVNLSGGVTELTVDDEGFYYERLTGTVSLSGGDGSDVEVELTFNIPTRIEITELDRFPQLPSSILINDEVYRVNYVRNFDYDKDGSSATLVLDETTPFNFPAGEQTCTFEFADDYDSDDASYSLVIVKNDHRLQRGATVIFDTTDELPGGLNAGQEYYVILEGLDDIRFRISSIPSSVVGLRVTDLGSGTHTYQRIYELITPGNRSMLGNDFTQVNDLGYGLIATNGGLIEAVSVFTYYCHISYYTMNGGQIRSVSGSSAHGNYALVAQGSDPLEVPTPMGIYEDFSQGVTCYFPNSDFTNEAEGFAIWVTDYTYIPIGNSELEIDHSGEIFRYTVNSVTVYNNDPSTGIAKLNIGGSDGLKAGVPDGTKMTVRNVSRLVVSGNVVNVAVRPSTGLLLNESPERVYRVLEFTEYVDPNGPYICTISNGSPAVITKSSHRQQPGYQISFTVSEGGELPEPLELGRIYYVLEDGITENTFRISTVRNGNAINTTTAGSGTFRFIPRGLATAKTRENYDYILINPREPNEFDSGGTTDLEFNLDPGPGESTDEFIIDTGTAHGFNDGDVIRFVLGEIQASGATIAGTTATITFAAENFAPFELGQSITVAGFVPSGYNGTFTVTGCTTTQVTYVIATGTPTGPSTTSGFIQSVGKSMPGGLFLSNHYFVRDSDPTTFRIAIAPGGAALRLFGSEGVGPFAVGKVKGVVGDTSFFINAIESRNLPRLIGSKFVWIGEEYIITDYDSPGVTGEAGVGRLYLNRALIDGVVTYGSQITLRAGLPAGSLLTNGTLTVRISLTRATGHDLLDIGTGGYADTNYPNEIYGPPVNPPVQIQETQERNVGRVFYVTTDQFGNVSVGPFFKVDQGTGTVTINAPIAVSNLSGLGFKDGVTITEFSIDTNLNNAEQTKVPTEFAVKLYIDRRLGMDHEGNSLYGTLETERLIIPAISEEYPGGFLALNGNSQMISSINMLCPPSIKASTDPTRFNKIINLGDPVNPRDAVNLQSLTIDRIQGLDFTTPTNNQLAVMTGNTSGDSIVVNASVNGDVTFGSRAGNSITTTIVSGAVTNNKVSDTAAIDQTKLSLNNAFATTESSLAITAASGTGAVATLTFATQPVAPFAAGQKIVVSGVTNSGYNGTYTVTVSNTTSVSYTNTTAAASTGGTVSALRGIATFNQSQFIVTNGFVGLKDNGISLTKLQQINGGTILGNSSGSAGNVSAISYSTVTSGGGALLTSQYTSAGILRAAGASGPFSMVGTSSGSSTSVGGNDLIQRDANGDFGGRYVDVQELRSAAQTVVNRDSGTSSTKFYGFDSNRGVTFSGTAATSIANYDSARHDFKFGTNYAPIYASTAEVGTLQASGGAQTSTGSIVGRWTLTGVSRLEATYAADLAEYYEADKEYTVGTVLIFGGEKEVTISSTYADTRIAGVVSNTAAYVMYDACPGIKTLIALQGRVPCKVVGKISKGDLLVTSNIPGVAISAKDSTRAGTIIGKALANFDSDHIGTIEVAVGRN